MMLAIKEAASDMSPYVRKTAAHAIPKLYRYTPRPQPTPGLSQIFQAAFFFFFFLKLFRWFKEVWGTDGDGGHWQQWFPPFYE